MDQDRRKQTRLPANLGTEIEIGGVRADAMTVDASDGGVLVLTRAHPAVGAKLSLRIMRLDAADPPYAVHGEVVRIEKLELGNVWSHRLAVRLVELPAGLHDEIERASERHKELYGS